LEEPVGEEEQRTDKLSEEDTAETQKVRGGGRGAIVKVTGLAG